MGFFDELMGDIKVIRKGIDDTKRDIMSTANELTSGVNDLKKEVIGTIDETKKDFAKTKEEIKGALSLKIIDEPKNIEAQLPDEDAAA